MKLSEVKAQMANESSGLAVITGVTKFDDSSLSGQEKNFLAQAAELFKAGFPDHALLDVWNAAVANLRRRVEAYGVDLFRSVIKDEPGRKKYDSDGDTLSERWSGVDDLVLIAGALQLGVLNKKAAKSLEMINWMRNHASPAHDSDHKVENEDVIGLVLILKKNLFEHDFPDPGHSVSALFDPVKTAELDGDALSLLADQIEALTVADLRVAFGFMLDLLCKGETPSLENVQALFPVVWARASDELKKTAGLRYHSFVVDSSTDDSDDKGAKLRLLDFLVAVSGIQYIPDAARATLYRKAAKSLAKAKDTSYGWTSEVAAAKSLAQLGPHVPSIAVEEVYQEILAVSCGNYWGRSDAHTHLRPFIDKLSSAQIMTVVRLFQTNERVQSELFQSKPAARAVELLDELRAKLTLEVQKDEVTETISLVEAL